MGAVGKTPSDVRAVPALCCSLTDLHRVRRVLNGMEAKENALAFLFPHHKSWGLCSTVPHSQFLNQKCITAWGVLRGQQVTSSHAVLCV